MKSSRFEVAFINRDREIANLSLDFSTMLRRLVHTLVTGDRSVCSFASLPLQGGRVAGGQAGGSGGFDCVDAATFPTILLPEGCAGTRGERREARESFQREAGGGKQGAPVVVIRPGGPALFESIV